jgi:hypothetical protein
VDVFPPVSADNGICGHRSVNGIIPIAAVHGHPKTPGFANKAIPVQCVVTGKARHHNRLHRIR